MPSIVSALEFHLTEFEMDQCGSTRLEKAKQNFFKVHEFWTLKKNMTWSRNVLLIIF